MSEQSWQRVLVLGGIRSGKSQFAESLVAPATGVRYVATAAPGVDGDEDWTARVAAHRDRRPPAWTTEETGTDPVRLITLIAEAKPDETLLVDDLGGWVAARLGGPDGPGEIDPGTGTGPDETAGALAAAIRGSAARLVLVSPEVGLSLVPTTALGRAFADAVGEVNQAVAAACDAVVLVVAGQATWLKPSAAEVVAVAASEVVAVAASEVVEAPRPAVRVAAAPVDDAEVVIGPGMDLPMPDEEAIADAHVRLRALDLPGAGLGELHRLVVFAAGAQARPAPQPWRAPRVLLLHGDHAGGAAAGVEAGESARRAELARAGHGPLAVLAARAGAELTVVVAPAADPIEDGPALTSAQVVDALAYGWQLAAEAVDSGVDVLVIGACGTGTEAAAAAVLAATAGAEAAAILPRAVTAGGRVDDNAWMVRCAAVRDALHRTRRSPRDAHDVLAELGGGDIAIATGVLLGATARRTPVLLDGPVGVAAALVSRDLAGQVRHWCLLPDHGGSPLVRLAADVLGLTPFTDLGLDVGEGAAGLAALPLLTAAVELAAVLPTVPAPDETEDD